jgi:hypothetical protein
MAVAQFNTSDVRISHGSGLPSNVLERFGISPDKPEQITDAIAMAKPIKSNIDRKGIVSPSCIVITNGKAEVHLPPTLPPDHKGRALHDATLRAKAEETKARLRKKLAERKAGH